MWAPKVRNWWLAEVALSRDWRVASLQSSDPGWVKNLQLQIVKAQV